MSIFTKLRERIFSHNTEDKQRNKELSQPVSVSLLDGTKLPPEKYENMFLQGSKISAPNGLSITFLSKENEVLNYQGKDYSSYLPREMSKDNLEELLKKSPLFIVDNGQEKVMMYLGGNSGFISDEHGNRIRSLSYMDGLEEVVNWTSNFSNAMFEYLPVGERTKPISENAFYQYKIPIERINSEFISNVMALHAVMDGEKLSDIPLENRTYEVCEASLRAIKGHRKRVDNIDFIPNEHLDEAMISTGLNNGLPLSTIMPYLKDKKMIDYAHSANPSEVELEKILKETSHIVRMLTRDSTNDINSWRKNSAKSSHFVKLMIDTFDKKIAHKELKKVEHPSLPKINM